MQQTGHDNGPTLRFAVAGDLLAGMPQLNDDIDARPEDPSQPTMDFVQELTESETPEEALMVCAYALPPRYSVWWGHECMMRIKDGLTPKDIDFLQMTSDWVAEPTEERRRAIVEAAYPRDEPVVAGQWIALGAGWTAGSMNPADMPEVPPEAHLSPTAILSGVLIGLASVDIDSRETTLASFVKMARQLAEGS